MVSQFGHTVVLWDICYQYFGQNIDVFDPRTDEDDDAHDDASSVAERLAERKHVSLSCALRRGLKF